jgi:AcrR family transcriptional regulator
VTATSLYYYYKDKEALFTEIKLHCIKEMDKYIFEYIEKKAKKSGKLPKKGFLLVKIRAALEAFRDWAFINPRIALLVMGRLKADTHADSEKMKEYYQVSTHAQNLLDQAVKAGCIHSRDTLLDTNICIAALWGAIELVLHNRTSPQYWPQRRGMLFTNKMIDMLLESLTRKNRQK